MSPKKAGKKFGAKTKSIDLSKYFSFPLRTSKNEWWKKTAEEVRKYPTGKQQSWGIPFKMAKESEPRAICVTKDKPALTIELNSNADFLCFLHEWRQIPETIHREDPTEGLVVAEYEITYSDGSSHVQPVRGRFEVNMAESPGPAWLAESFQMHFTIDPANHPMGVQWGHSQTGTRQPWGVPMIYAMPNPNPTKKIKSLTIRGLQESPLMIAGLTLYSGSGHPLSHLPRRTYRVKADKPAKVEKAQIDMGEIARIEHTNGPRGKAWMDSPYSGLHSQEPERGGEDLIEAFGASDAILSVSLEGRKKPFDFSLGKAFHEGKSASGEARLEVLGKKRQWMRVKIIDGSTGRPTPARVHLSGSRGEYLAPYGHHSQINPNWFEDYGADVLVWGRSYAYVPGEFTTDMPVGDVFVEINKGFEYQPVRAKVSVKPGQKMLELKIERWKDLRSSGWVTADTHVHFISPHTAWLEGQAEGVNVINLLASQWGRLFTNVGDITGKVGIEENDTIVYVGTENRNHMLGHMSMLGTQGLSVYPMCCGGPGEAYIGDPDFMMLAEWALENKRKGGVVIRPHFPYCGFTEDPVPILKGLVDGLEIRTEGFATQEWYRYLNCGYRVAVVGGTDKMGATTPVGWSRTYAKLDPNEAFTYGAWGDAVRAGKTISTTGPLLSLKVEGREIGDSIQLPLRGGALEVEATAECFAPISRLEIVYNGRVVLTEQAPKGSRVLHIRDKVKIGGSGWIAARCMGIPDGPGANLSAHTSPVYLKCGETRAFDGPAAEHMLGLVEGGIEYLNTLATVYDEPSRKRMVKLFKEAQQELKIRLVVESQHTHHHGDGAYHTHGHGITPDHKH